MNLQELESFEYIAGLDWKWPLASNPLGFQNILLQDYQSDNLNFCGFLEKELYIQVLIPNLSQSHSCFIFANVQ